MTSRRLQILGALAVLVAIAFHIYASYASTPTHADPKMTRVVECQAEDGGPVLPCIWKHKDQDGNYLYFTK